MNIINVQDQECYEYHKEQLKNYEETKHLCVFNMTEYRAKLVRKALLEYRRQHNIFEPDDLIVYNDSDFIYKIDTTNRDGMHATTIHQIKRCVIGLFNYDTIRHATDEEIKAGYRLDRCS